MEDIKLVKKLQQQIEDLTFQLDEATETIDAIRSGKIDALVVVDHKGPQLYTLKTADQTYRVFIEKMKEGAVTLSNDGLILYSNSTFAAMLELPLSQVIGQPFSKFISDDHQAVFKKLINLGWQAESKGEVLISDQEQNLLPVLLSLTTLQLDEGIALSIIITDLTSQKEIEQQLKSKNEQLTLANNSLELLSAELEDRVEERTHELLLSREHFRFLSEQMPVIVWKAKPNGDIEYFNQKWFDYTGLALEESQETGWLKVVHPEDLAKTLETIHDAISSGEDFKIEYRFLRASDNTYRWHSGMAVPYKNELGKIVAWFGISTDIQEQKIALSNKDEFISMVSHELKTPVTTLKAFTQLLLLTLEKENIIRATGYLYKMDKQINKLTALIADLLDATKVNAGVLHYEKEKFDFNELVVEIVDQMRLTSETHDIDLNLTASELIIGDRNRIGQVITNLITNAFKYSPKANKIEIFSTLKNGRVILSVKDFGIGVPEDQQAKLFNRFFRATEVKSNTFPGLGLGLYISNEIIKRHSGLLTFKSKLGEGSVFSMELPFVKSLPEHTQL